MLSSHTHSDNVDEGCFARVLKTDKSELHLLFPEEALEPLDDSIEERQHLLLLSLSSPRPGINQMTKKLSNLACNSVDPL